jgi:hypothetical protein
MTITKLGWIKLVIINCVKKTRIEHYRLPIPRFAPYLRTWGETGTVKTGIDRKMGDQGQGGTCMFVGYASNDKGDCCRMWNLKTKIVFKTCDVVFLNRMLFKTPKNTKKLQRNRTQTTLN